MGGITDVDCVAPTSHRVGEGGRDPPVKSKLSVEIPNEVRFCPALINGDGVIGLNGKDADRLGLVVVD